MRKPSLDSSFFSLTVGTQTARVRIQSGGESTNGALTLFIRLKILDDIGGVGQRGLLSLLLNQELHQVLRAHEACGFRIRPINHINLLPMGQQVVEVLDLLAGQVPRFGFVTFLWGGQSMSCTRRLCCKHLLKIKKDHLKEHLGVDVVHFQVDETQEVLHLGLTQLVIFVLVGLPQAAQDPAEKFSM